MGRKEAQSGTIRKHAGMYGTRSLGFPMFLLLDLGQRFRDRDVGHWERRWGCLSLSLELELELAIELEPLRLRHFHGNALQQQCR